jgi:molybdopterin synthase catalytic subunit
MGEKTEIINNFSGQNIQRITSDVIELENILKEFNGDGESGALVFFIGCVRNNSSNGPVKGMYYEAYLGMAEEKIIDIENFARNKWNVNKIKVIHRIGELNIGDKSIAIIVSASHSKEALETCQFILSKIKNEVPIWKKEILTNGNTKWVEGNLISS